MAIDFLSPDFPSINSVIALIEQGESQTVEFKIALPPESTTARILTSFANTNGGVFFIGVDSTGNIVGVPQMKTKFTRESLAKIIESLFTTSDTARIYQDAILGDITLIYVVVRPVPDYLRPVTTAEGKAYIRRDTDIVVIPVTQPTITEKAIATEVVTVEKIGADVLQVFIAMSFHTEEYPELEDYFDAMSRCISRIIPTAKIVRMDLKEGDYEISEEIMRQIDLSHIVIADFAVNSANVYFELGYARGKGKRAIQTIKKGYDPAFDIRSRRTIIYRNARELEAKLEAALQVAYDEIQKK